MSIRSSLRETYKYDVITRNCVTELLSTMKTAGLPTRPGKHKVLIGLGLRTIRVSGSSQPSVSG